MTVPRRNENSTLDVASNGYFEFHPRSSTAVICIMEYRIVPETIVRNMMTMIDDLSETKIDHPRLTNNSLNNDHTGPFVGNSSPRKCIWLTTGKIRTLSKRASAIHCAGSESLGLIKY